MAENTTDHANDRVAVSGPTKLESVDAREFSAAGHTTVSGDVHAEQVDLSGATTIQGDLYATTVDTSGATTIEGDAVIDAFDASGRTQISGAVTAGAVDTSGSFTVGGHVGVETLQASGATELETVAAEDATLSGSTTLTEGTIARFEASGALNADRLEGERVTLHVGSADMRVDDLQADHVTVDRSEDHGGFVARFLDPDDGRLSVDTLAADEVDLVEATVREVTADTATIGPGCEIEVLRARDWSIDDDATVETTRHTTDAQR